MKNNSVKTAPKGRMPPTRHSNQGLRNQGCGGIGRGIELTRQGKPIGSLLYAAAAPRYTKGTEIPNHKTKT